MTESTSLVRGSVATHISFQPNHSSRLSTAPELQLMAAVLDESRRYSGLWKMVNNSCCAFQFKVERRGTPLYIYDSYRMRHRRERPRLGVCGGVQVYYTKVTLLSLNRSLLRLVDVGMPPLQQLLSQQQHRVRGCSDTGTH